MNESIKDIKEKSLLFINSHAWDLLLLLFLTYFIVATGHQVKEPQSDIMIYTYMILSKVFPFLGLFALMFIAPFLKYSIFIWMKVTWFSIAAYSVSLWAVGTFGDEILLWIMENQKNSIAWGISVFLFYAIYKFGKTGIPSQQVFTTPNNYALSSAVLKKKCSPQDVQYTSAHESGHVLVYAALPKLPNDLKVVINQTSDQGALGSVSYPNHENLIDTVDYSEWRMLCLLAGKYAEKIALGKHTCGSSNDHERWLATAKAYLSNHHHGIYYNKPENQFEQKTNDQELKKLQEKQIATLDELFQLNKGVYKSINDELFSKQILLRDDLIPLLEKVVLPDDFPQPNLCGGCL